MKGMRMAGDGRNVRWADDKRCRETLSPQDASTDKLPEARIDSWTGLGRFRKGVTEAEIASKYRKAVQVCGEKQVLSLVRAGTLTLQSRGQAHSLITRLSI
jgi:hypothetical protein